MDRFQSKLTTYYVFHPLLAPLKSGGRGDDGIPSLDLLLTTSLLSELLEDLLIILPELAET